MSYDTYFTNLGQGDLLSFMRPEWVDADDVGIFGSTLGFILSFPTPAFIALAAYIIGAIVINHTAFGRHVLAVGGGTEASRLMGLPVDRTIFLVYVISGGMAGMAGVILASQFGAGQPIEGVGWELFAIASVVVGGTLLTGGNGSIGGTLAGALLLGIIFTILNFENGMGWISLSAYWQSVVRGLFLFVVVVLQAKLSKRAAKAAKLRVKPSRHRRCSSATCTCGCRRRRGTAPCGRCRRDRASRSGIAGRQSAFRRPR